MKKTFVILLILCVIAVSISILVRKDLLDIDIGQNNSVELESQYITKDNYYYNTLTEKQQEIYLKAASSVINLLKQFSFTSKEEPDVIRNDINLAMMAYIYDNPQIFYINSNYKIKMTDFIITKRVVVEFSYSIEDIQTIQSHISSMDMVVTDILNRHVTNDMTEIDKELMVHDAIIKMVQYYNYNDIKDIPNIKHSAYGALVEKEAVCDGISKAFKIIMNKLNIECIVVGGVLDDIPHAWNIVKIDGSYYHVDLTSNIIKENKTNHAMHIYFNLTDQEIKKTHSIDEQYVLPMCVQERNNYYNYKNYYITPGENVESKLNKIIFNSEENDILEFKISDKLANSEEIANLIYRLDFNNYKTRGKTKISYRKVKDIYIIIKD